MLVADNIWVPDSYASKELVKLNRAVREYDERLMFGRNEVNGDWCVFVKMPNGDPPVDFRTGRPYIIASAGR